MTDERQTIDVAAAAGGWPLPWPNVAELAEALPSGVWTLVGGLMTQLHSIHHSLGVVRPTDDVDIVLHVETGRGAPSAVASGLEGLGYQFKPSIEARTRTAHRFVRDSSIVDVLIADHPAPRVIEKLRGHDMVRIDGGTQALRRTINARLEITPGTVATISVPRPFGALVLKSAAFSADSRDRDRHLLDAAALLACIDDPYSEVEQFTGSDRRRIATLAKHLVPTHGAWQALPRPHRAQGVRTLEILARGQG